MNGQTQTSKLSNKSNKSRKQFNCSPKPKYNRIPEECFHNKPHEISIAFSTASKLRIIPAGRIFCIQSYKEDQHLNLYIQFYNSSKRIYLGMITQKKASSQFYISFETASIDPKESRILGYCDNFDEALDTILSEVAHRFNLSIDKQQKPEYRNLSPFVICFKVNKFTPF